MKPFLLIATREVDRAADSEYEAMLRFSGLQEDKLRRVRMEQGPVGRLRLDDFSGVIVGGGPFNASDAEMEKSAVQLRVEAEISALLDEIVPRDFPFLGACYGIGTLGLHQGALVDRTYPEPVGTAMINLTQEGRADQLFEGMPGSFEAFLGHREAISKLPAHAVNLAYSAACPVQAFRVGRNVYATQFHPELDVSGMETRIDVYKHAGYFEPHEADALKARARAGGVVHPPAILRRFVELFSEGTSRPGSPAPPRGPRAGRARPPEG